MTLPIDPVVSFDPGSLVTRPPPPPPASRRRWCRSSFPTDPALPGGSAWEKFYGVATEVHKGFERRTSTYSDFLRIVHNPPPAPPQPEPPSPQETGPAVDEWSRPGPSTRTAEPGAISEEVEQRPADVGAMRRGERHVSKPSPSAAPRRLPRPPSGRQNAESSYDDSA